MKKLSLVLALAMILSLVSFAAGCAGEADDSGGTGTDTPDTSGAETQPPADLFDKDGYLLDELPGDLDYGGKTVNIFMWSEYPQRMYSKELNADIINDAIYLRNQAVEERLGVKLEFPGQLGNWANRTTFVQTVSNSVLAGSGEFDIVDSYNVCGPMLLTAGAIQDLTQLEYIDLEKPWWNKGMLNEMTIDDRLYLCAGDINYDLISQIYVMFYNKKMAADYNIPDLYDLTLSGKWTIDRLEEYTKPVYEDLNGNTTKEAGDKFGIVFHSDVWFSPFISSFGLKITEMGDDGYPKLNFGDKKFVDAWQRVADFVHNNQSVLPAGAALNIFTSNQALFAARQIGDVVNTLKTVDAFEFGVLPFPKWDEAQDEYVTFLGNEHSLYSIPNDAKDPDMSAAVLECMASESHRKITPAYYDTSLKVKYSSDEIMSQMFDLLRNNVDFNFGVLFGNNFSSLTYAEWRQCVRDNKSWATRWAEIEQSYTADLARILEEIKKLP